MLSQSHQISYHCLKYFPSYWGNSLVLAFRHLDILMKIGPGPAFKDLANLRVYLALGDTPPPYLGPARHEDKYNIKYTKILETKRTKLGCTA